MSSTISKAPVLISIEGNIGSGKSTLLRELKARHTDWHFIDEPVESWMALKNAHGESLLELFYKDKGKWAYTFQNTALLTRILNMRSAIQKWREGGYQGKPIFITERCVQTDAYVFAKLMHADKDMDELEWTLYKKWYDAFAGEVPSPCAYIHVDTPVTICSERIGMRAREGEATIPVEYLDKLDSTHFAWLRHYDFKTPLMRFDNVSEHQTRVEDVESFVEKMWLEAMD